MPKGQRQELRFVCREYRGLEVLGKTLEQLAVRRAMSEAIPAASGSK